MARDRADAEAGDVGVGIVDRVGELVDERAEAGAEHEPDARREARRALLDRPGSVVHPRLSGPKDSGSSSASDVVRRTRSMSARWIGASAAANSRSRWRQPPHGAHSCLARCGDDDLHDPPAAARHHRAERRGLRALALGVGGVLDVGAGVAAAVVGQHGGADGEVGVRRVGAAGGLARQAKQLGIGHGVADRVGVRALAELLDAELCAKAPDLGVLVGEVRALAGHGLELDERAQALTSSRWMRTVSHSSRAAAASRPRRPRRASRSARRGFRRPGTTRYLDTRTSASSGRA